MYIACCHPRKVTKNNLADNTSLLCNTKVMCCSNLLCGRRTRLDSSRRAHMSMCNLSRRVPLLVLVSYHRQTDRLLPKFQRSFTKGVCCSPACIADATVRTHILGLNHTGLRRIPLRDRGGVVVFVFAANALRRQATNQRVRVSNWHKTSSTSRSTIQALVMPCSFVH